MTNDELREIIRELVVDEEELNSIVILEGDEYAEGALGLSQDNHVVYSYSKLVESLMAHNYWTYEEAAEWLDYNTLRAIPYMKADGNEPIIVMDMFSDYLVRN